MKIVLLSGNPSSGKTTTFNMLYDALLKQGAVVKMPKKQVGDDMKDFECVLVLKNISIALFSMGDCKGHCFEAIIRHAGTDVQSLAMAYSDKHVGNIATMVGKYKQHVVVKKTHNNIADVAAIISALTV